MGNRSRLFSLAVVSVFPFATYACGLDSGVVISSMGSGGSNGTDGAASDGTGGGGGEGGGDSSSGDSGSGSDSSSTDSGFDSGTPLLVYANTQTDLYSFDVSSSTLTHVASFSSCGSDLKDIAIDNGGLFYLFVKNDAIYDLTVGGVCSGRNVLSAIAGDDLKISARAAGTPSIVAVDPAQNNFYSIDPASSPQANVNDLNNSEFSANPPFDVTCSNGGTCWSALDHSKCTGSAATDSCLVSFPADGSADATGLGHVNAQPAGLAYAGGALYSFNADGSISKITLGGTPTASAITVNLAGGTTQPGSWQGAASTSSYP